MYDFDYNHHCCMYAAAMHHVTGLPVYYLGGGHAVMETPKGWLDEAGIHPLSEIAAYWNLREELDKLDEFSLNMLLYGSHGVSGYLDIPGWDEVVADARKLAVQEGFVVA